MHIPTCVCTHISTHTYKCTRVHAVMFYLLAWSHTAPVRGEQRHENKSCFEVLHILLSVVKCRGLCPRTLRSCWPHPAAPSFSPGGQGTALPEGDGCWLPRPLLTALSPTRACADRPSPEFFELAHLSLCSIPHSTFRSWFNPVSAGGQPGGVLLFTIIVKGCGLSSGCALERASWK